MCEKNDKISISLPIVIIIRDNLGKTNHNQSRQLTIIFKIEVFCIIFHIIIIITMEFVIEIKCGTSFTQTRYSERQEFLKLFLFLNNDHHMKNE